MKNYIVQNVYELPLSYNEWFLVKADSKKEALYKVYKQYGYDFNKNDFKVYSLDEFYKNSDTIDLAVIH